MSFGVGFRLTRKHSRCLRRGGHLLAHLEDLSLKHFSVCGDRIYLGILSLERESFRNPLELLKLFILTHHTDDLLQIAFHFISRMNIGWIESWSKRKGLGADLVRKYEDSETKICLPKVRSLARPCHPPGSLLLLLLRF
ncbi:hypothetical protein MtrunA17_Chr1g0171641 [Medicago truncatula]|uniref:Uncharacterized protein n=1 Tax=Medicago truncatula TaxID=3880 RepID=A0A396JL40_MEDTR|nr:hypothetical protein MtrunA17_Chr1g0171641 [Medicago truncatula]